MPLSKVAQLNVLREYFIVASASERFDGLNLRQFAREESLAFIMDGGRYDALAAS